MPDTSDRASPDQFTLVLRAAFVPDGEQPPPELAADFSPLKFRATLDTATGTITCDNAGMNFDGDIRAEWHPDEQPGSEEGEDATGEGDDASGVGQAEARSRSESRGQLPGPGGSEGHQADEQVAATGSALPRDQARDMPNSGARAMRSERRSRT